MRPYKTEGGEELLILQEGIRTPAEVFRSQKFYESSCTLHSAHSVLVMPSFFYRTEQNNNRTQTWLYRLGGWLAIFLGLTLLRQFYDISNQTVFLGMIVQIREELRVSLILNAVKFLSLPWTSFPASVVCLLFKSAPCPSLSPSPSRWAS